MSARRITKKQLKEDKFAEAIFNYGEMARQHQRTIIGVVALIIIVIVGGTWGARYLRSSQLEGQYAFSQALKGLENAVVVGEEPGYLAALDTFTAIRNDFSGKEVGKWAIYFEGYCFELNRQYTRSEQLYNEYLEADRGGEYELAARLGIAAALGSTGNVKQQADALIELAKMEGISVKQSQSWVYEAGRIYMESGYFESARSAFEGLLPDAEISIKNQVEQQIAALDALPS